MQNSTPSVEERLARYATELDSATAQQMAGAESLDRSQSAESRRWTGLTVGLAAATVAVVGLGFLAAQRDQPAAPLASSPAPTTVFAETTTPAASETAVSSSGGIIEVPQSDSDAYRPPWDPIAIAPGTIGWFEFGDGVPASVSDPEPAEPTPYAEDDVTRSAFFRCVDWTISDDDAPTCTQLAGGNGVEHTSYGDQLGVGVALGPSTVGEQLWVQAQGSLWGYEEVTEPPEPTTITFGDTEAVSYRNGDHAYLAWDHAPGVVVWLQSRGLDDTELAFVAAGVRPAELPSELPVLISLNDPQPVPSGPGSISDERSVKLGFLDGEACVGIVMWEQCTSTAAPAVFASPDGETLAAIAPTGTGVLLDIDLGTASERLEMDPTGFGFDLAVFDNGDRPIESLQLVTPTGDTVADADGNIVVATDDGVVEADDPVGCGFYSVVVGDSRAAIAERFGTTIDEIDSINQTTDSMFDVGTVIEIPCSGAAATPIDASDLSRYEHTNVPAGFDVTDTVRVASADRIYVASTGTNSAGGAVLVDVFDAKAGELLSSSEGGDTGCAGPIEITVEEVEALDRVPIRCTSSGQDGTLDLFIARAIFTNDVTVLVGNASTTGGAAGALTASLDSTYETQPAVNANTANIDESVIYYRTGSLADAQDLADQLGGLKIEPMPEQLPIEPDEETDTDAVDILILLGNDWTP